VTLLGEIYVVADITDAECRGHAHPRQAIHQFYGAQRLSSHCIDRRV
jgi:hypothetical protein